ncbi:sterile alpha motif domain-containing protein 13 isoform X1 [Ornithorhynchus anatinus]|uniref:sterile alpha motif domain-containing protein 13 isoform X1 n=1 Tax=Ornithorhynchus anatinus TaxID=9258 RepID=UPI0010A92FB6|nr:sterile alpha motif domain-containing protein 13 isoform X1 [Ornithorhynchus anatinus]
MVNYYKILGVPQNASSSDIKKAYRQLALQVHPDKNPENKEAAEKLFKKVVEAYEVLSDAQRRSDYDQSRRGGVWEGQGEESREEGRLFEDDFTNYGPAQVFEAELFGGQNQFSGAFMNQGFESQPSRGSFWNQNEGSPFFPPMESTFSSFVSLHQGMGPWSSGHFGPFVNNGSENFRLVTTSSQIVNGRKIITKKIFENGKERIEVKEESMTY